MQFAPQDRLVPRKGLEPSRPKALVPKTSVSTNSTTAAKIQEARQPYFSPSELEIQFRADKQTNPEVMPAAEPLLLYSMYCIIREFPSGYQAHFKSLTKSRRFTSKIAQALFVNGRSFELNPQSLIAIEKRHQRIISSPAGVFQITRDAILRERLGNMIKEEPEWTSFLGK